MRYVSWQLQKFEKQIFQVLAHNQSKGAVFERKVNKALKKS